MRVETISSYGVVLLWLASLASAATINLGNGYRDHGVGVPLSNNRGIVAAVDGANKDVVLLWLMDCRGGYELLLINAQTGASEEFPIPFTGTGDSPYSSLLSTTGKFYTHFNNYFVEFDPVARRFTFCSPKTSPQMAMSFTQDDSGVVWSFTYPQSGVCSFNPVTRQFHDYGQVYTQTWSQYPRYSAADDKGWLYFAIGNTASQLLIFNPTTGAATAVLPESERKTGLGYLYRDLDGKVYGKALNDASLPWYQLYNGVATKLSSHTTINPKPIITGDQSLFYKNWPDSGKITSLDTLTKTLVVQPAAGGTLTLPFTYTSEGANIMGVATAPDGTVFGGTSFPMQFFNYTQSTDTMINRPAYGQWNTVLRQNDKGFVGAYTSGSLLQWTPSKPWVATVVGNSSSNPLYLTGGGETVYRPTRLLALGSQTIVMAGTPGYGYTGGGLVFWNRSTSTPTLLTHSQVITNQSTVGLVQLSSGLLLGGTTTSPGTGGQKIATVAELYLMDPSTKVVQWHAPVFQSGGRGGTNAQEYNDLCNVPGRSGGLVYGIADRKLFFVFDPVSHTVIYQRTVDSEIGLTAYQQGPRVFVTAPDGKVYMLFNPGIVSVDGPLSATPFKLTLLAAAPLSVQCGGDYSNGRIYFSNGSHLYSYQVK